MSDGNAPAQTENQLLTSQYAEICRAHGAITDFRGKLLAILPAAAGIALLSSRSFRRSCSWGGVSAGGRRVRGPRSPMT
jgi:hypothetical protein